jgi:hypothetical protein
MNDVSTCFPSRTVPTGRLHYCQDSQLLGGGAYDEIMPGVFHGVTGDFSPLLSG